MRRHARAAGRAGVAPQRARADAGAAQRQHGALRHLQQPPARVHAHALHALHLAGRRDVTIGQCCEPYCIPYHYPTSLQQVPRHAQQTLGKRLAAQLMACGVPTVAAGATP